MQEGPLPVPSIRDIEDHDAVFVLGEDLTQTAARIALALRQSVKGKAVEMAADMKVQPWLDAAVKNIAQHAQNPLFIASVSATRLDDVAEETVHAAPDDLARLASPWPTRSTQAPRPWPTSPLRPRPSPSASPMPCWRPSVRW